MLLCVATSVAQTATTNLSDQGTKVYPWRGGVAAQSEQPTSAVQPPIINGNSQNVRFFQASAQDGTQQPAVGNFSQGVPNPPANSAQGSGESQPALSVQSNAISENSCNQDWCQLGEPRRLFGTSCNGLTIGGFNQTGFHNSNTLGFNNMEGKFRGHQAWLYVGREASRNCNWDMGFRVDGMYGLDAQDIQALGNSPTGAPTGWDNGWDNGSYGFALPQAYLEFANYDWNVRVGRFLSPIGYESVPSIENFFYSRTYLRTFTEPFTHTGVLAQKEVNDRLTYVGGLTLGWNSAFENTDNGFNLITGFRYRSSENVKLGVTSSVGDTGYLGSGVLTSAFTEVQLTDRLCYVLQGDYLNLDANDEFGIVNSLYYHVNNCLAFGGRLEWWKSDRFFQASRSTYDWTFGANYRPNANVVIRPELRNDWGAGAIDPTQTVFGVDAIFAF